MTSWFCLAMMIAFSPMVKSAERPPEDFAEVRWEASLTEAKTKLLARPGLKLTTVAPDQSAAEFEGGVFAGFEASRWKLSFEAGHFRKGEVWILDKEKAGMTKKYETLKASLASKYGKAEKEDSERRVFHSAAYWSFEAHKGSWKIACDVDERTPGLRLTYTFTPLEKGVEPGAKGRKKDL